MPFYIWKPSYELGLPELDRQHRQLVGLINELYDAMKHGRGYQIVEPLLDQLMEYVQLHFSQEEQTMRDHGYPWLDEHVEQHLDFTTQVLKLREMHQNGDKGEAVALMNVLMAWFRDHITGTDKEFGRYIKKQEQGAHSS
jgi:hemerythrin-like metal-binding protein